MPHEHVLNKELGGGFPPMVENMRIELISSFSGRDAFLKLILHVGELPYGSRITLMFEVSILFHCIDL